MERKDLYDNKVEQSIGTIVPKKSYIDQDAVISCFNRYRSRIKTVSNPLEKEDSFIYALHHSYNSEKIYLLNEQNQVEDKVEYLSLINAGDKDLLLSAPLDLNLSVGRFIKWIRDDSVYLITKSYPTERSYFKGDIKKANFIVRWEDEKGNLYETWAAIIGSPETRFKSEQESTFYMDRANDSIDIWIPQSKNTEVLRRYKKLIVKGKVWTVNVVDDITSDKLLKLSCVEDYLNKEVDDLDIGIVDGKNMIDYKISCAIDNLIDIEVGKTININPTLYRDGVIVPNVRFSSEIEVIAGSNIIEEIDENSFTTIGEGAIQIKIKPDGYPASSIKVLNIVPTVLEQSTSVIIKGSTKIKQGFTSMYVVEKIINGELVGFLDGRFSINNNNIKIISKDGKNLFIEGVNIGSSKICFDNGIDKACLDIEITSLFGE